MICRTCGGSGQQPILVSDEEEEDIECSECGGSGYLEDEDDDYG